MGERKVLNKYIPADFDPKLVPRGTRPKGDLVPVRMMLPFSMQCSSCSTFLYRGRKFNSKKEPVKGPSGKYLGIQRFRLYIKCSECSRPITFLTDPQNADYEVESGATRNYDVHHDKERTLEEEEAQVEAEEKDDPLKALENRVEASKREMADMDNLEEILAMNQRHAQIMRGGIAKAGELDPGGDDGSDDDHVGREQKRSRKEEEELNEFGLTEAEEALVQSVRFGASSSFAEKKVWRLQEEDEAQFEQKRKLEMERLERQQQEVQRKAGIAADQKKDIQPSSSSLPNIVVRAKRKRKQKSTEDSEKKPGKPRQPATTTTPLASEHGDNNNSENKATSISSTATRTTATAKPAESTTASTPSEVGSGGVGALGNLLGSYGSDDDSD